MPGLNPHESHFPYFFHNSATFVCYSGLMNMGVEPNLNMEVMILNRDIVKAAEIVLLLIGSSAAVISAAGVLENHTNRAQVKQERQQKYESQPRHGRQQHSQTQPKARVASLEPPAEATEACKGKSEGGSAEFTTVHGETLKGTCRDINGTLSAVPEEALRKQIES